MATENELLERIAGLLEGKNGSGTASKVGAALSGAAEIASASAPMLQTGDVSEQRYQIDALRGTGLRNFSNYDQFMNAYSDMQQINPDLSFKTLRGGSDRERIGGMLAATAAGATAGTAILPGWGTAIGAGVGALASGMTWLTGNQKAKSDQGTLSRELHDAVWQGQENKRAAGEVLADNAYRNAISNWGFRPWNSNAEGGSIERSKGLLRNFTESVSEKSKSNDSNKSLGITRTHVNGGVRIKFNK